MAAGLDHEDTTGVAVDARDGEVYADNGGSVAAFSSGGSLIQRFGSGQLNAGGAVAVDGSLSESDPSRGDVFVAEPVEGKIAVFAPEVGGAPEVDSVYAQSVSSSSERLSAQIDPKGAQTTLLLPVRHRQLRGGRVGLH